MSDLRLRLGHGPLAYRAKQRHSRIPLGQILVNAGVISHRQLMHALNQQLYLGAPLGEVLAADGLVDERLILDSVALQHDARRVDLAQDPPDARLFKQMPPAFWATHQVVPWLRLGDTLFVATSRPDTLKSLRFGPGPGIGAVLPVVASAQDIATCLTAYIGPALAHRAETRVKDVESCRTWNWRTFPHRNWIGAAVAACLALALFAPLYALTVFDRNCGCHFAVVCRVETGGLLAADQSAPHRICPHHTVRQQALPAATRVCHGAAIART